MTRKTFALPLFFALIAALGPPGAASAEEILQRQGTAQLLTSAPLKNGLVQVALSDLLRLTIVIEGSTGLEVDPGGIAASDSWKADASPPETVKLGPDRIRWRQELVLEPLRPGELEVRFRPWRYREGKGEWTSVDWKPIRVRVTTRVARSDPSEMRDITAIEELPSSRPLLPWWAWLLVGLGLVGVLAGVYWLRRKRRVFSPPSPEQWASRELDRVMALKLPERGEIARFHGLLAHIVRGYLEKRYHLPARRQTTPEFLEAASRSAVLSAEQQQFLRDFLDRCDLAKFAGAQASVEECAALSVAAREFIQKKAGAQTKT